MTYSTKAPTRLQMRQLLTIGLQLPGFAEKLGTWLTARALTDLTLCLDASGQVGPDALPDLAKQLVQDEHLAKRLDAAVLQAQVLVNVWGPAPELDALVLAATHGAALAKFGNLADFDAWASSHASATDYLQGPGCGESWLEYEVFSGLWQDALTWMR